MSEKISDLKNKFERDMQFMTAQNNALLDLQNKLKKAEEENAHLKSLLTAVVPKESSLTISEYISSEEAICLSQIEMLRSKSDSNIALTLEETRKLEIYTKILKELRAKESKDVPADFKKMTDEELLNGAK